MGKIDWKFSLKALQSIYYADSFINIWEGAVRSSKTVASEIAWLNFLERSPHTEFLMTGKTEATCYRNVIGGNMGIINIMGKHRAKFKKSADGGTILELKFKNRDPETRHKQKWVTKICYIVGMNDRQAEEKIRGMTVGGWYADEVTLYPESAVKQAINRMSLDGAQAFWTCNPDSPYHYIKTEFIDRAKEKGYRVFHFELDDNPALSERYKQNIKNAYKGLWYKRMVLGLWVMADGVIYDVFNSDFEKDGGHVVTELPQITRWWVGVDYGQSNATAFILFGQGVDGRCYVIDEYYHSGKDADMAKQKTPAQYADDLVAFIDSHPEANVEKVFIDPSAKGFILEAYRALGARRRILAAAINDVNLGIDLVTTLIGSDKLRVHYGCVNFLREITSYVWDPAAQKQGKDKPLKQNDHTQDAFRYGIVGTRKVWRLPIRSQAA